MWQFSLCRRFTLTGTTMETLDRREECAVNSNSVKDGIKYTNGSMKPQPILRCQRIILKFCKFIQTTKIESVHGHGGCGTSPQNTTIQVNTTKKIVTTAISQ
jgi:hypothetical protein